MESGQAQEIFAELLDPTGADNLANCVLKNKGM